LGHFPAILLGACAPTNPEPKPQTIPIPEPTKALIIPTPTENLNHEKFVWSCPGNSTTLIFDPGKLNLKFNQMAIDDELLPLCKSKTVKRTFVINFEDKTSPNFADMLGHSNRLIMNDKAEYVYLGFTIEVGNARNEMLQRNGILFQYHSDSPENSQKNEYYNAYYTVLKLEDALNILTLHEIQHAFDDYPILISKEDHAESEKNAYLLAKQYHDRLYPYRSPNQAKSNNSLKLFTCLPTSCDAN